MNSYIAQVRHSSIERMEALVAHLDAASELVAGKACVYATGSFGRLEAGPYSDLDLFIVIKSSRHTDRFGREKNDNLLGGIDEIKLKYRLIDAVERNGIAEFDGDGKYLDSHRLEDFTRWLGSRDDDYRNTLTGRLLLLLESKVLIGRDVYENLIECVIQAYFKDFSENKEAFIPAFLLNDILRLWRTFCVNYEFHRKNVGVHDKVKNLKLKYTRMLTCYSAVTYLLNRYVRGGAVTPADVRRMVSLTPTERLESVHRELADNSVAATLLAELLNDYGTFLKLAHHPKSELEETFALNEAAWKSLSYDFGRKFSRLLAEINRLASDKNVFFRMIQI